MNPVAHFDAPKNMFSPEFSRKMEETSHVINQLVLINNKKIDEFRSRVQSMSPDLQDLATIVSTQMTILEEKYTLLNSLIYDIYVRLEPSSGERTPDV